MPAVIAFPAIPGAVHPDCKCHLNDRVAGTCCCSGKSCCGSKPNPKTAPQSCCATKSDTSMCSSDAQMPEPEQDNDEELQLNPCGCGSPISQGGLLSSDPRLINARSTIEGPAALVTNCCEYRLNWSLNKEAPATPPPKLA